MTVLARWLLPLGIALLVAASGPVGADLYQARLGDADLTASIEDGLLRLESGGFVEAEMRVPSGTKIHSLGAVDGGWIAAGSHSTASGIRLFLRGRVDGLSVTLPAPPGSGRLRLHPNLLVADGELAGLLWLEGPDRRSLRVRAARWNGSGWSSGQTLADAASGSQLALQAEVLSDGTWLAVWSRYDGNDDEIFWTRHNSTGWSPPRRIYKNNTTPDITPALLPLEDGAVVAWSRYDGNDYRIVTARYRAGSWNAPQMIGARGSVFPRLLERDGRPYLFYRATVPAEWTLLELSTSAAIKRRAVLPVERRDWPEVVLEGGSEARLRWPGEDGSPELRTLEWR